MNRLPQVALLALPIACSAWPHRAPTDTGELCRHQVVKSERGCSVVEFRWKTDGTSGLVEMVGSTDHDLAPGEVGTACGDTPVECLDELRPPPTTCTRGRTVAHFTYDDGGCIFAIEAPLWDFCQVTAHCGRLGGIIEGTIFIPEGHAGRAGTEILWCSCQ